MTREEKAIKMLKSKIDGNTDTSYEWAETVRMAIKVLEQEPILDKIRADIENHCGLTKADNCKYCYDCHNVIGVREILEIIDKYKAESEDK